MGDIRDMDADPHFTAVQRLVGEGVVEILRVVRVDGEDGFLAVIEPVGQIRRLDAVGNGGGLALDVGGKFRGELVLEENPEQFRTRLVGPAEPGGEGASKRVTPVFPLGQLDDDLVAFLGDGAEAAAGGIADHNLIAEARVVGLDDKLAPAAAQVADDDVPVAFKHAHDAADFFPGAAAAAAGGDARNDAVTRQGDAGVLGKDLHRRLLGSSGHVIPDHKGGTAGAELNASGQFVLAEPGRGGGRRVSGGGLFRLGAMALAGGRGGRRGGTALGGREDRAGAGGTLGFAFGTAGADASALGADELAAFQQEPDLVGQHGTLFFSEAEAAGEFEFVCGRVICLAQKGEEAVSKSHGMIAARRAGCAFVVGLTKGACLTWRDENRPRGE